MNTRDMWENQVELLTRHCQTLNKQVDELELRLEYFEGVVTTLLTALVNSGVIKPEPDDSGTQTYEF